jgi:hypothetical protein
MLSKHRPGVHLTLLGLAVLLGGSTPALAQVLEVRTDRGCGSQAVYQSGELVQFFFRSSQTVNGRLTLTRPDGTALTLANQTLLAGVTYTLAGRIGLPAGTRTLTLTAGSASATCTYSLGGTTPPPPSPGPAQRILGALRLGGTQEPIIAPTVVGVGQDFQVTMTTFGDGCVEKGDEGVVVSETGATIFVYDFTTATQPGVPCTQIFKRQQHTVTLRFTQPGEKLIQVWGRQDGGGTTPPGAPVILEARVLVQ